MENRQNVVWSLMRGIAESADGCVVISKSEAQWLLDYLKVPDGNIAPVEQKKDCQLFYCAHCGKSFWFPGEEDASVKRDYGYSVWYASCPTCGEEIRLTDRYWR